MKGVVPRLFFRLNERTRGHGEACERYLLQLAFHRVLHLRKASVENLMDAPPHGACRIWIFVEMKQRSAAHAFHGVVHIEERYFFERTGNRRAAASPRDSDDSRRLELQKKPADDDRVHVDAAGDKVACHFARFFKRIDENQYMYGDGKSA